MLLFLFQKQKKEKKNIILLFINYDNEKLHIIIKNGAGIVSGGADNTARLYDIATGQATQVAEHTHPVKCVKVVDILGTQMIITGSWDSTIKYWDMRQPRPVYSVDIPDKCYAMDAKESLMVAATARQDICIFDLRNPKTISKVIILMRYYSSNIIM